MDGAQHHTGVPLHCIYYLHTGDVWYFDTRMGLPILNV